MLKIILLSGYFRHQNTDFLQLIMYGNSSFLVYYMYFAAKTIAP
jgi:hypothetical protein